jgi:hypothetical protein
MGTVKRIALIAALAVGIPWSMAPMAHAATIKDLQDAVTALQATVSAQAAQISALQATDTAQAAQISALQATDTAQASQISAMQTKFTNFSGVSAAVSDLRYYVANIQNSNVMALNPYVSVDTTNTIENATGLKGPHIIFTGANVHIRSGAIAGSTDEGKYSNPNIVLSGLGNLIVGYNEPLYDYKKQHADLSKRGGSHNLIVGPYHKYESAGGFVAGAFNNISGFYSTVSGGILNEASAFGSSVSGGNANFAIGPYSSVSGGDYNTADGGSVSGGLYNTADAPGSSISGGEGITLTGGGVGGWAAGGTSLSIPSQLIIPLPSAPPWFYQPSDYLGTYHSQ